MLQPGTGGHGRGCGVRRKMSGKPKYKVLPMPPGGEEKICVPLGEFFRYDDLTGRSGIAAWAFGEDYIDILFRDGGVVYRYSFESAGAGNVKAMWSLALLGCGLNRYLNRNVRDAYETKWVVAE